MFALMKEKVENPESDSRLADALPSNKRPVWFLELAVVTPVWMPHRASSPATNYGRFERHVPSLNISGDLFVFPPIDAWIIRHAYMFSPKWVVFTPLVGFVDRFGGDTWKTATPAEYQGPPH